MIISVWCRKGGAAKSTTATALARTPLFEGMRALFDLDPQTNATLMCGHQSLKDGITKVLTGKESLDKIAIELNDGSLLIPGDEQLDAFGENWPNNAPYRPEEALAKLMEPIRDTGWFFLDCPPGLTVPSKLALNASDYVLIPMLPDLMSFSGLLGVVKEINRVRSSNQRIKLLGVVLCRVPGSRNAIKIKIQDDLTSFCAHNGIRLFKTIIRERIAIQKSQLAGEVLTGEPAEDYTALAKEILEAVHG